MMDMCNEIRLHANEMMRRIYVGDFPLEDKKAQLEILKLYAEAALRELDKEASPTDQGEK